MSLRYFSAWEGSWQMEGSPWGLSVPGRRCCAFGCTNGAKLEHPAPHDAGVPTLPAPLLPVVPSLESIGNFRLTTKLLVWWQLDAALYSNGQAASRLNVRLASFSSVSASSPINFRLSLSLGNRSRRGCIEPVVWPHPLICT